MTAALLLLVFFSASATAQTSFVVRWTKNIKGDFSFRKKWSYPEGVYRNELGKLVCDGLCPEVLDTIPRYHTMKCEAWCYEYAGADFMEAISRKGDTLHCFTLGNAATHCSLQLLIAGDSCKPSIVLHSIVRGGATVFYGDKGTITVSKRHFQKGIFKAKFDFVFKNTIDPQRQICWKGRVYAIVMSEK